MKNFNFFGAPRATRERHFETSSPGDENGVELKHYLRVPMDKGTADSGNETGSLYNK